MLKKIAIIFGVVFILIGILGFIPALTPEGKLLGLFSVNDMHNGVHILSGIVALICAFSSELASRYYFIVFGIIYALVTIIGFAKGEGLVLGMAINQADNFLHLIIAVIALYLGFSHCCSERCESGVCKKTGSDKTDRENLPR